MRSKSNDRIHICKELFYVLGALLGDGYRYNWKIGYYFVGLHVTEKKFADRFADNLSKCVGRKMNAHYYSKKSVWWVKVNNMELFDLLGYIRERPFRILEFLEEGDFQENSIKFIEGFFDAEGCVKIIKEPVRITPKVCLDITNTNCVYLEFLRMLLHRALKIEARFSIQRQRGDKTRRMCFHLRVYKKSFVRKFFENIETSKLRPEKVNAVNNWLSLNDLG